MRKNDLVRFIIACAALAVVPMMIATIAGGQVPAAPPAAPAPPAPQIPPTLVPSHVVDLLTADGLRAFGAQWKTREAKVVEGPALPTALAGCKTSYDVSPPAAEAGFDAA